MINKPTQEEKIILGRIIRENKGKTEVEKEGGVEEGVGNSTELSLLQRKPAWTAERAQTQGSDCFNSAPDMPAM